MTDHPDPVVRDWFAESELPLDDEAFTERVVKRARFQRLRTLAPWLGAALAVAIVVWWFAVPLDVAQLVASFLSRQLVDLGDGWIALVTSPLNSIAALAALVLRVLFLCRRKIADIARRV